MKNRKFTVLVVSNGGRAPLNFTLSTIIIAVGLFSLVLLTAVLTTLAVSNYHLSSEVAQLPVLEKENAGLAADLLVLEAELADLQGQMAELEMLGREVRGLVSGTLPTLPDRSGTRTVNTMEDTDETISYLREIIPQKAEELELLREDAESYRYQMDRTPDLLPVNGRVTSPFGWRRSPFTGRRTFHNGVDFGAPSGTPVLAAATGIVVSANYQRGWGNLVIINHGTYRTLYAHLRSFDVKAGDSVEKGQPIARVGSTGNSTGPHLHFEIHKTGRHIDPLTMLNMEVAPDGI